MYLLAQFILQNFKKFLKMIQSYENVPFSDPKWHICLGQKIFGTKVYITFIKLLVHCAKFKKNSYRGSRVMRMHHFWAQNGPFAPNNFFFWKIINIIFIKLLAPFIVQQFKKILPGDPELWGCTIFGPKMTHLPKWEFFQKTC